MPTLLPSCHPLFSSEAEASEQLQIKNAHSSTHSELLSVAPVLQFIIACVEGECLHDIGASPQELPVQLAH